MDLTRIIGGYENTEQEYYLKVKDLFVTQGFSMTKKLKSLFIYFDFYKQVSFKVTGYLSIPIFFDDVIEIQGSVSKNKYRFKVGDIVSNTLMNGSLSSEGGNILKEMILGKLNKEDASVSIKLIEDGPARLEYEKFLDKSNEFQYLDFDNFTKDSEARGVIRQFKAQVFGESFRLLDFELKDLLAIKILYYHVLTSRGFLTSLETDRAKNKEILVNKTNEKFRKLKRTMELAYNTLKNKKVLSDTKSYVHITYL